MMLDEDDLFESKDLCLEDKCVVQLSVIDRDGKAWIIINNKYKICTEYLNEFILPSLLENMKGTYEIDRIQYD